jgi:hypothetical protein
MRPLRHATLLICLAVAACSGQKEPAHKLIADIDEVVAGASAEAAQYVPNELKDVQDRVERLRSAFGKQDYATVVGQGPDVLNAAQALAPEAAAKKDAMLRALNDAWTDLAAEIPVQVAAVQARLDELAKKSSKRAPAGVDVDTSRSAIGSAMSLWSKAQAAFAAGNMDEAVNTAKDVKVKVSDAASAVKLDLPKTTTT